ncbi:MAG: hypothetical protein QOE19_2634 [Actinomycetota bacterium]|nr:hypothetical protein [Actinomycetota bacterium]MDQ1666592.1 hypothetical protein [Actinomycetota bacterium]MDQ1668844.1 hypothetical protein [Actinomycetota bacterium]
MQDDEGRVDDVLHELDDEFVEESRTVRPYTLTRGRTRPGREDLRLEALVRGVAPAGPNETTERRRILELTGAGILSVAELSAHLSLPLGVVRVLVGDLADDGLVVVHSGTPQSQTPAASQLKVLESVLDGISSL